MIEEFNKSTAPTDPVESAGVSPFELESNGGSGDGKTQMPKETDHLNSVPKRLLTPADILAEYGFSTSSISRAMRGNLGGCTKLPFVGIGRRRYVRPETLEAWLLENER